MPLNYVKYFPLEHAPVPGPAILVQWTYTQEEWKRFLHWSVKRKSFFQYLCLHLFKMKPAPEIRISSYNVWIGDKPHPFRGFEQQLKRIDIKEAGTMNILEITFMRFDDQHPGLDEIILPIPKGKLKEAIDVQERLTHHR